MNVEFGSCSSTCIFHEDQITLFLMVVIWVLVY